MQKKEETLSFCDAKMVLIFQSILISNCKKMSNWNSFRFPFEFELSAHLALILILTNFEMKDFSKSLFEEVNYKKNQDGVIALIESKLDGKWFLRLKWCKWSNISKRINLIPLGKPTKKMDIYQNKQKIPQNLCFNS